MESVRYRDGDKGSSSREEKDRARVVLSYSKLC